jgi:hypothetical protein
MQRMKRFLYVVIVVGLGGLAYVLWGRSAPAPSPRLVEKSASPIPSGPPPQATAEPAPPPRRMREPPPGAPWGRPERREGRRRRDQLLREISRFERTQVEAEVRARIAAGGKPIPKEARSAFGTLDKEYIRAKIEEAKPLIKECYELGLAGRPDLAGKLTVKFSIVADPDHGGVVERAEVVPSRGGGNLDDRLVHECVSETLKSITFDPPRNGGRVLVRYPFVFAPGDGGAAPADGAAAPPAAAADGGASPAPAAPDAAPAP